MQEILKWKKGSLALFFNYRSSFLLPLSKRPVYLIALFVEFISALLLKF